MRMWGAGAWIVGTGMAMVMAAAALGSAAGSDELQRARAARPDPAHGAQLYTACVACHGVDGAGETNGTVPRIAGQHASVLIKQIIDFRHRRRWDLRMEQVVSGHRLNGPQDVADVAAYVSTLSTTMLPSTGDGQYLQRGASAYLRMCARCHGASGQGDAATAMPRLAGQHAAYLLRQMQETATNGRPNMTANHVEALRTLSYEDFVGAADYLSRMRPRVDAVTRE
jgi:cytochrome c553